MHMADLVEIAFPSEQKAEEGSPEASRYADGIADRAGRCSLAVKQPDGRVKYNQLFHPTAAGAASGAFWGALIGMLFLMPLPGAAIDAASGAIGGALSDIGI